MKARVVFLCAHVKHYRAPFFESLYNSLHADGIDLRVLYGEPNVAHAARHDNVDLPESYGRRIPSYWLSDRFVYQSALKEIAGADLVITPNEHKLLLNPLLLALRAAGVKRVAFWGKGDFEKDGVSHPGDWLRCLTANAVDWWFPYTAASSAKLRGQGVRCGITPIHNAIDTFAMQRDLARISQDCLREARAALDLGNGPIGVFCGNLSPNKELPFLFAAAKLIREHIPDFHLLVLGNGPLRHDVEVVASHERYIHYLGPRVGREKAVLLAICNLFLLPGAVGLAILDAFAAGLPLLTTHSPQHGPEISYLQSSVNGVMTPHEIDAYANCATSLLQNRARLETLRFGAAASSRQYTIENMVASFRHGILDCLRTVPARRVPFSMLLPPATRPLFQGEQS